jgi:hypothetical protein
MVLFGEQVGVRDRNHDAVRLPDGLEHDEVAGGLGHGHAECHGAGIRRRRWAEDDVG